VKLASSSCAMYVLLYYDGMCSFYPNDIIIIRSDVRDVNFPPPRSKLFLREYLHLNIKIWFSQYLSTVLVDYCYTLCFSYNKCIYCYHVSALANILIVHGLTGLCVWYNVYMYCISACLSMFSIPMLFHIVHTSFSIP
jgi:hypothetical protein